MTRLQAHRSPIAFAVRGQTELICVVGSGRNCESFGRDAFRPMKLVLKLTLALVVAMCAVLAVNGYFRVKREVGYAEADRVRDHEMVGRALGAAFATIWRSEGRTSAMSVIDEAEGHFSMTIRWIEADAVLGSCQDLWPD